MTTLDDLSQPYLPPASGVDNAEFAKVISQVFLTSVIAAKVLDWSGISKRWARSGFMTDHFNSEVSAKFVQVFKMGLAPILVEAAMHGMRQASSEFVVGVNVPQAVVTEWASVYAQQVAQQIANQSTLAVQDTVNTGVNGRLPAPALADRAQQVYGLDPRAANTFQALSTSKNLSRDNNVLQVLAHLLVVRGGIIGEVQSIAGINFGKQLVYMQAMDAGQLMTDARKVWLTALDERVCEICGPMDGIAVPINDMFEVQLPFPKTGRGKNRKSTQVMVPPVHPNCRCTIVTEDKVEGGIITRTSRKRGDLFSEPEDTFFQKNWEDVLHPRDKNGQFVHGFHRDGVQSRSEQVASLAAIAAVSPFAARHIPTVRKIAFLAAPKTEAVQGKGLDLIPRVSSVEALMPMKLRPIVWTLRQGEMPYLHLHTTALRSLDEVPPEGLHAIFHPDAFRHMDGADIQATLYNVESHIAKQEMEHSVVMTPSGRILSFGRGDRHSAPAPIPPGVPRSTSRFLIFTHNHPSAHGRDDVVLSAQDIVAAATHGIGRIRAVTPNGKVTEVIVKPGVTNEQMEEFAVRAVNHALEGETEAFERAFPRKAKSLREELDDIRNDRFGPDDNNPEHLAWVAKRQSERMEDFYRQEHLDPNGVMFYRHMYMGAYSKRATILRDRQGRFARSGTSTVVRDQRGKFDLHPKKVDQDVKRWLTDEHEPGSVGSGLAYIRELYGHDRKRTPIGRLYNKKAKPTTAPIYRGLTLAKDPRLGSTMAFTLSSFTSDAKVAHNFARNSRTRGAGTPTVLRVLPGIKGLHLAPYYNLRTDTFMTHRRKKEVIAAGRVRVVGVYYSGGTRIVEARPL